MAELVNKINGPWFSKFDEDLATAFSIYCGISIAHVSSSWAGPVHLCAPLHTGSPFPSRPVHAPPGIQGPATGWLSSLQYLWPQFTIRKLEIRFPVLSS